MIESHNTIQRQIVLETVLHMQEHPSAEDIYRVIHEKLPSISKGTVYRNLNFLAAQKKIHRIELPNAPDRFDFNTSPHYHFLCKSCGRIYDFPLPYCADLEEHLSAPCDFEIHEHEIVVKGLCPNCKNI